MSFQARKFQTADVVELRGHVARTSNGPASLPDHISALRIAGTSFSFARNETIFQEGDPSFHLFQVASGTVRLCRHAVDGRRQVAEFLMPGDLFGVLDGNVQTLTAEAVTDVTLISYSRAQLNSFAELKPRFRAKITAELAANLNSAQRHAFVLSCQCAKERVASFFLRLAERTGAIETGRLTLCMGRQDIADHLGLTIETVCRAITQLKKARVIELHNACEIELRSIEMLCELSGDAWH